MIALLALCAWMVTIILMGMFALSMTPYVPNPDCAIFEMTTVIAINVACAVYFISRAMSKDKKDE